MTSGPAEVVQLDPTKNLSGNGGGNGSDGHLRSVEIDVARIDERVSAIQEHMATKNDVTGLKVWILVGVLSGGVAAAGLAVVAMRAFL